MIKFKEIFLVIIFLLCISEVPAHIKKVGIPFIHNFTKSDYNAGNQNWDIVEDSRGIMYFANTQGILQYDGETWQLFKTKRDNTARSLAVDKNNKVYYGSYGEFGYLKLSEDGEISCFPISNNPALESINITNVWRIHLMGDRIVFQDENNLYIYNSSDDSFKVIQNQKGLKYSFQVGDRLFVHEFGKGLLELRNDDLVLISDNPVFMSGEIKGIFNSDRGIIIASQDEGLFIMQNKVIKPWDAPVNQFLKKNQIFCALTMSDNSFIFGTIQSGVVFTDPQGKPTMHLYDDYGLQNNTILSMEIDKSENLWLGLDNGLSYIEISSPFSKVTSTFDMGTGYCSIVYKGILYLGTNLGVFWVNWDDFVNEPDKGSQFKLIESTKGQVWNFTVIDDELYCGHNKGAFWIRDHEATLLMNVPGVWNFVELSDHPGMVVSGTYSGMELFKVQGKGRQSSHLVHVGKVNGAIESLRYMVQDDEGFLWGNYSLKGIYRFRLNDACDSIIDIKLFDKVRCGYSLLNSNVFQVNNRIVVTSKDGLLYYNKNSRSLEPYELLNNKFQATRIFHFIRGGSDWYWYFTNDSRMGKLFIYRDTITVRDEQPFIGLSGNFLLSFEHVYSVDSVNTLIATYDGFIHYNPLFEHIAPKSLKTLIRKVELVSGDSVKVIYGGEGELKKEGFEIPYSRKSIRFSFATPGLASDNQVKHMLILDGFDEGNWSSALQGQKEYVNLHEGSYVLHVKAVTAGENESQEALFSFKILPPWYRTIFAYVIYYLVIFSLLMSMFLVFRKKMKNDRERLIEKQMKELQAKEDQRKHEVMLAEQEIIRMRNEKLSADVVHKSKELANITMSLVHKNRTIQYLKEELAQVARTINPQSASKVRTLIRKIDREMNLEESWNLFEVNFDQVHENFIKNLKELHPELTPKDLRLSAYLRMNLSSKEIAPLLNISIRGVEISRYRLRKKMDLPHDANLVEYIMSL